MREHMGIQEILLRQADERVQEAESNLYQAQQAAQQAARKERKNTVANMRKSKFSAKRIADILGYPIEEVNAFFKELDNEK
jgi:predicted transposase YdaD